MRPSLVPHLRCPRCLAERSLTLTARASDEREVREGELACGRCAGTFAIADGIVDLLWDAPRFVEREAAGLDRFAAVMRADGWDRERILALPDVPLAYWAAQRQAIDSVLQIADFKPGERLLDIGSNTCWASNIFARRGLDVIALDIATAEMQGLRTAEYFFEAGDVYFERLLSVMYEPALASESLDYVFCCEVLHHNDAANLRRTLRECYRVLKPGGRLFVVNEPMRFPLRPKLDHAKEVEQFEGNEHVYFFHQYLLAVRAAGFHVAKPWMRGVPPDDATSADRVPPQRRLAPLERALRRREAGRRAIGAVRVARYAWRHAILGDRSLFLHCRKPQHPCERA
jgi:SAM-dependent methyltransferase